MVQELIGVRNLGEYFSNKSAHVMVRDVSIEGNAVKGAFPFLSYAL